MDKIKLYLFAICAIACIGMWIVAVISALFSIGDLGFIAFILLVGILTLMLGLPLLFLGSVLGITKMAKQ